MALVRVAAAVQLQMIPLLHGQVSWWSPHRSEVARALELGPTITTHFVPLSINPPSTRWALAVLAGAIVFFWIARAQFDRGGVRQTVQGGGQS